MNGSAEEVRLGLTAEALAEEVLCATSVIRQLLSGYSRGWQNESTPDVIMREIAKIRSSRLPLLDHVTELETWVNILFTVRRREAYGGKSEVKQCTLRSLSAIEIRAACCRDRTN